MSSATAFVVVSGVAQVAQFAVRYSVARLVPSESFAVFDTVFGLGTLLGLVLSLGLHGAVSHYVALHQDERELQQSYFSSAVSVEAVLVVVFGGAALTGWLVLSGGRQYVGFTPTEWLLAWAIAMVTSLPLLPTAALLSRADRRSVSVAAIVRTTMLVAVLVIVGVSPARRASSSLLGLWALAGVAPAALLLVRTRDLLVFHRMRIDRVWQTVRYGTTTFVHTIGGWALYAFDRVLLRSRVPKSDLGSYGLAYLVAFAYEQLFVLAAQIARPRVYRILRARRTEEFADLATVAMIVIGICAIVITAVLPALGSVLIPGRYGNLAALMAILTTAVFWSGGYLAIVNVLFFHERVKLLAAFTIVSGLLGVLPILAAATRFGVVTGAWGTVLGYSTEFALVLVAVRRLGYAVDLAVPLTGGLLLTSIAVAYTGALPGLASALLVVVLGSTCAIAVTSSLRRIGRAQLRQLVAVLLGRPDAGAER